MGSRLGPREQTVFFVLSAGPLVGPTGRWGQSLCSIDAQTAILIGGQGARMQFCKDPMWKLCTGQSASDQDSEPLSLLVFPSLRDSTLSFLHLSSNNI